MRSSLIRNKFLQTAVMIVLFSMAAFGQEPRDLVKGNLIQFNDNGTWSWYQDERAVVDTAGGKLIIGSDASDNGGGGPSREGDVEAVIFDFYTGLSQRFTLKEGNPIFYADDHNAPAFLVRPDGKYLAMFAAHFNDTTSHYRIYSDGIWGAEQIFNWKTERPGGANFQTTYSNLFHLSTENRVYNVVRGHDRSPNFMFSTDIGDTWSYGGMLTNPDQSIGYVNGYFKYWSNGVDRIDFICTEHHPRDYNTSIYHGYIKNGQSFKSDGTLMDGNIFDSNAPLPATFSQVFAASTVVEGMTM
ncbi:MAG: BNR-4 repeat-containing protein, partial [bacterium]